MYSHFISTKQKNSYVCNSRRTYHIMSVRWMDVVGYLEHFYLASTTNIIVQNSLPCPQQQSIKLSRKHVKVTFAEIINNKEQQIIRLKRRRAAVRCRSAVVIVVASPSWWTTRISCLAEPFLLALAAWSSLLTLQRTARLEAAVDSTTSVYSYSMMKVGSAVKQNFFLLSPLLVFTDEWRCNDPWGSRWRSELRTICQAGKVVETSLKLFRKCTSILRKT